MVKLEKNQEEEEELLEAMTRKRESLRRKMRRMNIIFIIDNT